MLTSVLLYAIILLEIINIVSLIRKATKDMDLIAGDLQRVTP